MTDEKGRLFMRRYRKTKVWSIPTITLTVAKRIVMMNPTQYIFAIIKDIPGSNRLVSAVYLTLDSKKENQWNKDKTAIDDIFHWSIIYDIKTSGIPSDSVIYAPTIYDKAGWVEKFNNLRFINRPTAALRDYMGRNEHG